MKPLRVHRGIAAPLHRINIDTDQIIPKQFLKRVERTGYENYLFFDWRFRPDGSEEPSFVLNQPKYRQASILIGGRNFGCGSSREHAPWALGDYGFRVVIAPSFADIFFNNCAKNGLLTVILSEEQVAELARRAQAKPGHELTVDLEKQTVTDGEGFQARFEIDAFKRHCLLNGLDDISLTLQHEADIAAFEKKRVAF
ncbi:MAG: 3-isopropylmalate dehydratase small subunit [Candidatus Korobacteraceae bacterium]|jgi:3-isopropylmalate/(R)-2-methylmalate dehydratase small subunit